jgi:hypothetical protein
VRLSPRGTLSGLALGHAVSASPSLQAAPSLSATNALATSPLRQVPKQGMRAKVARAIGASDAGEGPVT